MPRSTRFDPDDQPVNAAPQIDKVQNTDPDFAYQYVTEDRVKDYLHSTVVGNAQIGFKTVSPWQVVCRSEGVDGSVIETGRRRADDGEESDSVVRMANLILLRIPKPEHEKLLWQSDAVADLREKALLAGEKSQFGEERSGSAIPGSQTGVRPGQAGYGAHVTLE